jgi:Arylsulfotransferase (ASST)/Secretion system C-terminal sorting domain/Cep192 domain 4
MQKLFRAVSFCLINLIILLSLLLAVNSFSQSLNTDKYQFISPLPGSSNILPENNIIIREGGMIDQSTITNENMLVRGSKSGIHRGKMILSDDLRTLIFLPEVPYEFGEKVKVEFNGGIRLTNGRELSPLSFDFKIIKRKIESEENEKMNQIIDAEELTPAEINLGGKIPSSSLNHLPQSYPDLTVNISDNPSPGYFFLSLLSLQSQLTYLMIVDNGGIPLYYSEYPKVIRNFQLQPNGYLTYFDHSVNKFYEMDSSYSIIDSFYCGNGFESTTDFHELIVLPNGHSFLLARENLTVRMDTIVVGGDSAAVVSGFVIQELDANRNVIFQWRTFDYFNITDATEDINLLGSFINPFHCNSLALDSDGNLLLSSRHLDEITKINSQTGDIIWRWGGVKCANNQFVFTNDPRTFSHQHYVRRISNGNITMVDNGNLITPNFTRCLEYNLDEINKTATIVWDFTNDPLTFTGAAGNVQRLSDNNTFIGWGIHDTISSDISEVDLEGNIKLDISFPDTMTSYRSLKYSWKTNLFLTDPDSIFFNAVPVGDSASLNIQLKSNSSNIINISGYFCNNSSYSIEHSLPFILQPFQSEQITIKFKPNSDGYFIDTLHIRSGTPTSRIAQILIITASTDSSYTFVENESNELKYELNQNYPNPFNPATMINWQSPVAGKQTIKVFDVLGKEVATLVDECKPAGKYEVEFNAASIPSGVYFYQLQAGSFIQTRKMILLK